MVFRLESRLSKVAACAALAVLLAPFCYKSWARYRAARVAGSDSREGLQRAVDLQPGDADYQERFARYLLFVDQDAASALQHYQMAAAMNPYSAANWLGIAQSQLILDDNAAALGAIDKALSVDPKTPSVSWESANLLIALDSVPAALKQIRFVLATDPEMKFQGLQLIRRLNLNERQALDLALPPEPDIYVSFINMLVDSNELENAKQVWSKLIGLKRTFNPKLGFYYFEALLRAKDVHAAAQCWEDMARISPEVRRLRQPGNLVTNPGFEFDPVNGGLDWQLREVPGSTLQFDVTGPREGRRSLLLSFDGGRPVGIGLFQTLVLEPNSHYRFSAELNARLQSANGLQFVIWDGLTNQRLMLTTDVVETKGWQRVSAEFDSGPEPTFGTLTIGRSASSLIRGEAWIDDLQLTRVAQ